METEENNASQEDSKEKEAAMVIFLHLFKFCNLHDNDFKKIKHSVYGFFDFSNWFIQEYIYNQVSVKLRISQIACKNISNKRNNT